LRHKFIDLIDRLNITLGAFVRIDEIQEIERIESITGDTVRVDAALVFANGETAGSISFTRKNPEDPWLLLGISIEIPKLLRKRATALENEYDRNKAPDEVFTRLEEILDLIEQEMGTQVYEGAAPQFRDSIGSLEHWLALLADQRDKLGKFEHVIAYVSSGQNAAKTRARVYALLQYETKRRTGVFEFLKTPAVDAPKELEWQLVGYKVDTEATLPERMQLPLPESVDE
jgi:hypothetical protein